MIKAVNLYKFFNKGKSNEIKAVNGISFDLDSGLVMIVGKSGCGKSTLLHTLAGLEKPDSGEITVGDVTLKRYDSATWDKLRNSKIGYVFQNYNLIEDLTVYQNLEVVLKLAGVDPSEYPERIHYALSLVGMDKYAGRLPTTLSGGQQQRVGVARAIVKGAEILIADEPTGNLDDTNTIAVMEILKGLSKYCLVVVVTHEEDLAEFYADRIIRIVDGKIVEDYDNTGTGSLEHRAQDKIYLGDMEETRLSDGIQLFFPHGEEPKGNIKIVYQNGRVLLQVDGVPNVSLLNEGSTIKLIDGKFTPRAKTQEDLSIDRTKLQPSSGKPRNPFSLGQNLKQAFQPFLTLSGQRKRNPYRTLYVAAVFFVILLAFVAPSFVYNRLEQVSYDDHMLGVLASSLPEDSSYVILDGKYENNVYLDWSGLGLSIYMKDVVIGDSLTLLPASAVDLTIADGDIVVDKLLYTRWSKGGYLNGIAGAPKDMVGLRLNVSGKTFRIADVVDRGQPVLYLNDADYHGCIFSMPEEVYRNRTQHPIFVYAKDVKAAQKHLEDNGYTSFELNKNAKSRYYTQAFTGRIVFFLLGIVAILIQIFALRRVARSQYIGQIKSYVQYRAIGVPKKYLYGRIVSQNTLICLLTTLRGWFVTSIFMMIISNLDVWNIVGLFLGTKILYYPWWIALLACGFLYLVSLICNLASPVALLRRTPAALMTKYDI